MTKDNAKKLYAESLEKAAHDACFLREDLLATNSGAAHADSAPHALAGILLLDLIADASKLEIKIKQLRETFSR